MTGEKPRQFGMTLMKVEDDWIDLGDGQKIKVRPYLTLFSV